MIIGRHPAQHTSPCPLKAQRVCSINSTMRSSSRMAAPSCTETGGRIFRFLCAIPADMSGCNEQTSIRRRERLSKESSIFTGTLSPLYASRSSQRTWVSGMSFTRSRHGLRLAGWRFGFNRDAERLQISASITIARMTFIARSWTQRWSIRARTSRTRPEVLMRLRPRNWTTSAGN
jgi:hypothetical protein